MAATSEELNAKSDFMLQTVSFFKIGENSVRKSQKAPLRKEDHEKSGNEVSRKKENSEAAKDFSDQEDGFKEF